MAGAPGATSRNMGWWGGPDVARARLVDDLRDSGRLTDPAIEAAFRAVPRHVFLPTMRAADAYQDEAFVIKTGPDGLPLSSSSQPAIMAIMLEQLGVHFGFDLVVQSRNQRVELALAHERHELVEALKMGRAHPLRIGLKQESSNGGETLS